MGISGVWWIDGEVILTCTGVPRVEENAHQLDPAVGLCTGSDGGRKGVGVFLWARYPCSHTIYKSVLHSFPGTHL